MNQKRSSSKTMGQIMLVLAFIIGLGLLTLFFDEQLLKIVNPNQIPASFTDDYGVTEVELKRNRQGHYFASGYINSVAVDFLLDTGATDVAIPEHIARRVGLAFGATGQAQTANGVVRIHYTTINELRLGDIQLFDVKASIIPGFGNDTILLGMSALKQVELSQKGSLLTLRHNPAKL